MPRKKEYRKKGKYKLYDAFPTKPVAEGSAKDLRAIGYKVKVKKGNFGDGGRLKYGLQVIEPKRGS